MCLIQSGRIWSRLSRPSTPRKGNSKNLVYVLMARTPNWNSPVRDCSEYDYNACTIYHVVVGWDLGDPFILLIGAGTMYEGMQEYQWYVPVLHYDMLLNDSCCPMLYSTTLYFTQCGRWWWQLNTALLMNKCGLRESHMWPINTTANRDIPVGLLSFSFQLWIYSSTWLQGSAPCPEVQDNSWRLHIRGEGLEGSCCAFCDAVRVMAWNVHTNLDSLHA